MKEYVCKEDLLKTYELYERPIFYNNLKAELKYIPTITKVDICREFAEKIYQKECDTGMTYIDCMREVLSEMEQGK